MSNIEKGLERISKNDREWTARALQFPPSLTASLLVNQPPPSNPCPSTAPSHLPTSSLHALTQFAFSMQILGLLHVERKEVK